MTRWLLAIGCAALFAATVSHAQSQPQAQTQDSSASAPAKKPATAATHKTSSKKRKSHKSTKYAGRGRGQKQIDPKRAHDIQQALIREHYMTGTPSGVWDDATQKALQRYQADNGWQSKTTPDARALIKLGLGPDQEHLLNPESAMTNPPAHGTATAPVTDPPSQK